MFLTVTVIVVTLGIVVVLVVFLVTMLFTAELFRETAEVLAILTALFGVIGTLVGAYFGVKASADARQQAQGQAQDLAKGAQDLASRNSTSLRVSAVTPPADVENVEPDTAITATFSDDLDPASIKGTDHFTLVRVDTGGTAHTPVSGKVDYGPPHHPPRVAAFVPAIPLDNGSTYQATITTAVRDMSGNTLATDYAWKFKIKP